MNQTHSFSITIAGLIFLTACSTVQKPDFKAGGPASLGLSRFASFGTNKVRYVTVGRGNHTIVFVHCWAGNCGFWREQVPAFADKARLILIDLPGHGQSDKPHTNYTMDFFASAVLAVMRDACVDKATFVGHSMGVPVICRVYAQAPEKVAALVSVDGMLRRPPGTRERTEQFTAPFRAPDYREHTRRYIGSLFPDPATAALRDRVISDLLATPHYVMTGALEGMFGADQPDWTLKQVTVPVLVINNDSQMWTDDYKAYVRSLSPMSEYHTIAGVGHWLMLEKPAEFNAALIDMLQKFDLVRK